MSKSTQGKGLELFSLLLAGGVALSGCGHSSHSAQTSGANYRISIDTANGQKFSVDGVEFTISGDLKYEHHRESGTEKETINTTRVAGLSLVLDGETLRLGSGEFEGLKPGDKVVLNASGISVNGERRWDFPSE